MKHDMIYILFSLTLAVITVLYTILCVYIVSCLRSTKMQNKRCMGHALHPMACARMLCTHLVRHYSTAQYTFRFSTIVVSNSIHLNMHSYTVQYILHMDCTVTNRRLQSTVQSTPSPKCKVPQSTVDERAPQSTLFSLTYTFELGPCGT